MSSSAPTHPGGSSFAARPDTPVPHQSRDQSGTIPGWLQIGAMIALFVGVKLFFALPIPGEAFAAIGNYSGQISIALEVLLATWFMRRDGQTWSDLGLRWSWRPMDLAKGAGMALLVVVASVLANAVLQMVVLPALGLPLERTLPDVSTLTLYLIMMALILTTNSFGEEMVFRGFMMSRFSAMFGGTRFAWVLAAFAQAAIFGMGHAYQGIVGIIITGCVGLTFGLLYLVAKRNLWPMIAAHAIINTIGMTVLHLQATGAIAAS